MEGLWDVKSLPRDGGLEVGQVGNWVDWAFSLTLLIWSDGETPRDRYS